MKIIVDAFGGDHAPLEIMKGCVLARKEYPDVTILLSGNRSQIVDIANREGIAIPSDSIIDAQTVITVEDDPTQLRNSKKDSSMAVGFSELRKGTADAFVSAGSTAALAVGSSLIVGRIPGIKRAALAPIMPSEKGPFMLLDAGANLECRPEMLFQFGLMGSIYAREILEIPIPKVGLANVGTESSKGTEGMQEAYRLMRQEASVHFIGNIEAREIPLGACHVVVTDGISGNMILKSIEGMGLFFIDMLKEMFFESKKTKLAALLLKKQLFALRRRMDYTEYGGAVFMGIKKPVIKAHGSSDANAIKNAIRQAKNCVDKQIPNQIAQALKTMEEKREAEDEGMGR